MNLLKSVPVVIMALLISCTSTATPSDGPASETSPTPELTATSAVPTPILTPAPTPDIEATITARVQATIMANPPATPVPATLPPTMAPVSSPWQVEKSINPLDDSPTFVAVLAAKEGQNTFGDPVSLVLRCQSNEVNVYIVWGEYLGEVSDGTTITYRFGNEPQQTAQWDISTDNTASFFVGSQDQALTEQAFIEKLMTVDRFVAQVTPYSESPITAKFELANIVAVGKQVIDTCSP
jgi:type VI secretion system protein VasI